MNMKERIQHLLWKYENCEQGKLASHSVKQLYLDDFDKVII